MDMFGRNFCGVGGVELFMMEWNATKHPLKLDGFFESIAVSGCIKG